VIQEEYETKLQVLQELVTKPADDAQSERRQQLAADHPRRDRGPA
jgi:hypothetical protein